MAVARQTVTIARDAVFSFLPPLSRAADLNHRFETDGLTPSGMRLHC
jgi:hypothetical protein